MAREASSASQTARTNHAEVAERREQADRSDEKNHCGWSAGDHMAGLLPDHHSASVIGRWQRAGEDHERDVEAASGAAQRFNRGCRREHEIASEGATGGRFTFVHRDRGGEKAGCDHPAGEHQAAPLVETSSLGDGEGDGPRHERDKSGAEVGNEHEPYDPGRRPDREMLSKEEYTPGSSAGVTPASWTLLQPCGPTPRAGSEPELPRKHARHVTLVSETGRGRRRRERDRKSVV